MCVSLGVLTGVEEDGGWRGGDDIEREAGCMKLEREKMRGKRESWGKRAQTIAGTTISSTLLRPWQSHVESRRRIFSGLILLSLIFIITTLSNFTHFDTDHKSFNNDKFLTKKEKKKKEAKKKKKINYLLSLRGIIYYFFFLLLFNRVSGRALYSA